MRTIASEESICSIFRRKGGEGRLTKLFEKLPEFEQRALRRKIALADGEIAALAFFESDGCWCLLTNHRLVWQDMGRYREVGILQLRRVTHDMHLSVQRGELDRSLWRDLKIETTDGQELSLQIEPGKPFLGMWSVLHWLCGWAEKRRHLGVAA